MSIKQTWNEIHPIGKTIIVLSSGALIFFGIRKLLRRPEFIKLPQGGTGLPVVGYGTGGQPVFWNPSSLASELFDAMDGLFTLTGTKNAVWLKLAELPSDDMVVSVYNEFNSKYGDGETLTDWIRSEYYTDFLGSGKDLALNRLAKLNLK